MRPHPRRGTIERDDGGGDVPPADEPVGDRAFRGPRGPGGGSAGLEGTPHRGVTGLGACPSIRPLEPVQEWPDARRKEALRAERTESYVSTQGRLTTPQMAIHGQARRGGWFKAPTTHV